MCRILVKGGGGEELLAFHFLQLRCEIFRSSFTGFIQTKAIWTQQQAEWGQDWLGG